MTRRNKTNRLFCYAALVGLAACAAEPPSRQADPLQEWLEICADHGYSQVETAMATGREAPEIARRLPQGRPAPKPYTILPYPGGRHPRIGFLDGAVDPHRDTKFSLFLPGGGYTVVDFPEAVWREKDLIYLAHKHIPTYWEKKGVKLDRFDWTRKPGGVLESRRVLPDGVEYFADPQEIRQEVVRLISEEMKADEAIDARGRRRGDGAAPEERQPHADAQALGAGLRHAEGRPGLHRPGEGEQDPA